MAWGSIVIAVVGAAVSMYTASQNRRDARSLYESGYNAEMNAAIANAEAGVIAAEHEAGAILAGAQAQATGVIESASAGAKSLRGAAALESATAEEATEVAYAEAYRNVGLMAQESEESLRRLEAEQSTYEDKTKARIAASGGEMSGSSAAHYEGMIVENDKQYGWLSNAYANQRKVAMANANANREAGLNYAGSVVEAGELQAVAKEQSAQAVAKAYITGAQAQAGAVQGVAQATRSGTYEAYKGGAFGYSGYTPAQTNTTFTGMPANTKASYNPR